MKKASFKTDDCGVHLYSKNSDRGGLFCVIYQCMVIPSIGTHGEIVTPPSFILSKGGITSSDIAVKSLCIRRALVLGQIEKGVSVWEPDSKSKFPQTPYIVFPGNVGEDATLYRVYKKVKDT